MSKNGNWYPYNSADMLIFDNEIFHKWKFPSWKIPWVKDSIKMAWNIPEEIPATTEVMSHGATVTRCVEWMT